MVRVLQLEVYCRIQYNRADNKSESSPIDSFLPSTLMALTWMNEHLQRGAEKSWICRQLWKIHMCSHCPSISGRRWGIEASLYLKSWTLNLIFESFFFIDFVMFLLFSAFFLFDSSFTVLWLCCVQISPQNSWNFILVSSARGSVRFIAPLAEYLK